VEARNTAGDEFGEERLRELLQANAKAPSSRILARIQEAVATFSADTPQHDDITMMVVGYREPGEERASGPPGRSGFH
jgi:sigma-B regulation protein RsbU (phosphoserine phosphatase)